MWAHGHGRHPPTSTGNFPRQSGGITPGTGTKLGRGLGDALEQILPSPGHQVLLGQHPWELLLEHPWVEPRERFVECQGGTETPEFRALSCGSSTPGTASGSRLSSRAPAAFAASIPMEQDPGMVLDEDSRGWDHP